MIMTKDKATVLLTRSPKQNAELSALCESLKLGAFSWPTLIVEELKHGDDFVAEVKNLSRYDWLVFLSSHAVEYFWKKYLAITQKKTLPSSLRMACVGDKTAERLKKWGASCDLIPKEFSAKSLAEDPAFQTSRPLKIFLPQALDGRNDFQMILRDRHKIFSAKIYKKTPIKYDSHQISELKKQRVDWISFFSPSAVRYFMQNFTDAEAVAFFSRKNIATIGETTASSLREWNLEPRLVLSRGKAEDLIKKISSS